MDASTPKTKDSLLLRAATAAFASAVLRKSLFLEKDKQRMTFTAFLHAF
jgi:hypothetical protein